MTKKEAFGWLKQGKKTVDVRKGSPRKGALAVFVCGPYMLELKIVGIQSGQLFDVIREDNFRQVIPAAVTLEAALDYLREIYGSYDGVFTAYTVSP